MVCDKCGTEVTKGNKFCPKCGVEVKEQGKKGNGIIKPIIIVGLILVAVVLCIVMKYYAIIPLSGLIILFITILINRKILRMRKRNKDGESIKEYNLSDAEMKKFSGYFVSREEKYLSSLGNGYIMNFFAGGSLSRGFAVISDKRVYFRGSCFSGQGKNLKKTDEERTVDIRDVTGSGFIYRRYLGVLLGLLTALVVLVGGILGSATGALLSFKYTILCQQREEVATANYQTAQNADNRIDEIGEEIKELEAKKTDLQWDLDENISLQQEEIKAQISLQQEEIKAQVTENIASYLYNTELNVAYEEYLNQLNEIVKEQDIFYLLNCLEEGVTYLQNGGNSPTPEEMQVSSVLIHGEPNLDGNYLLEYYNRLGHLQMSPAEFLTICYGYGDIEQALIYAETYQMICDNFAWYYDDALFCNELINNGWITSPEDARFFDNLINNGLVSSPEDVEYLGIEAYDESWHLSSAALDFSLAYEEFISEVAPEYACVSPTEYTLEEIVWSNYLQNNSDTALADNMDLSGISTKYDENAQKITADINAIDAKITELKNENKTVLEMSQDVRKYEDAYNSRKQETFEYYMLTTMAVAVAGLLVTFFISCTAVFVDYLSKRKTLFEIQYAGGRIAFDVSFYAKPEIDDFQKQLRRAKDFAQETATVRTVTVESPIQTPVQAPTQSSVPDDLRKYADLLKEGLISQEEYDAMKKKILGL